MQDSTISIISDPYYTQSTWYKETLTGIREAAVLSKCQLVLQLITDPTSKIDFSSLPPLVVVTNGSRAYVNGAINGLLHAGKHVILSGVDSGQFSEMMSCATFSRRTDMERLVYYLIAHGRKRIALVGFWKRSINDMQFYQAAIDAARHYGVPIEDNAIFLWEDRLAESLVRFTHCARQFDAMISPNDVVSLCASNFCRASGIVVPKDLYITGVSNMEIGKYCNPSLTTIAMDFISIGHETFNVWQYAKFHLPRTIAIKVFVPGKLIIRASTEFKADPPPVDMEELSSNSMGEYLGNQFFTDPLMTAIMRLEYCLHQRDELDRKIIIGIMQGKHYETLAEELFISTSAMRYRRNKIFKDADVSAREAFAYLMRQSLGGINEEIAGAKSDYNLSSKV